MGWDFECEDQPDLTLPEETIFRGKVQEIKERTFEFTNKQGEKETGAKLVFWFVVEKAPDEALVGRKVKLETDKRLTNHPNNKLRIVASALLGREIGVGSRLSTDDLEGLPCEFTVKHVPDRKDPAKKWEEVDEVIPVNFSMDDEPPF